MATRIWDYEPGSQWLEVGEGNRCLIAIWHVGFDFVLDMDGAMNMRVQGRQRIEDILKVLRGLSSQYEHNHHHYGWMCIDNIGGVIHIKAREATAINSSATITLSEQSRVHLIGILAELLQLRRNYVDNYGW